MPYPEEHPGWDDLLDAMPAIVAKHPDHCAACRDARVTTERELRET